MGRYRGGMGDLGTVTALWCHPVKSMQGHEVERVDVDERGVAGDRRWAVRDALTGNVLTARRCPELLLATGGPGFVRLPDGNETDDDAVLSHWLGRPVEFIPALADRQSQYEAPIDPLDGEHEWVSWKGPTGSYVDSTKTDVSKISESSMRRWDPRRFRMNLVVRGIEEFSLVGSRVQIGTVVMDVLKRVGRCVMVTRPQPGLDRDLDVLKSVLADHGGDLGVGGLVVKPGTIALGDELRVIPSS
jgi:uncharacterized protein YcbX